MWASWIHNLCRLGPQTLRGGGQNLKWPKCGPSEYITPVVSGGANTSQREKTSKVAQMWVSWIHNFFLLGPQYFTTGVKI